MNRRSALVTGAAKRIGAFIAKHLAKSGYHVFVLAHKSASEGAAVVRQIIEAGGSAQLVCADLGRQEDIDSLMKIVESHDARLSVLVNNASIFEYDFPFDANPEILKKSIDIHIIGPFLIFERLKNIAVENNDVTIINILDQKLENLNPDYYSYTVGKMGLYALTKIWQSAQFPHLRTFGILLGLTMVSGVQSDENFQITSRSNPSGRPPELDEITALIDFFLDQKTLGGQTIALDGGASLIRRYRDVAFDPSLHPKTN